MRVCLFLLLLLFSIANHAQKKLVGRVMITGSTKAVPAASVYLSNTSVGAMTNEKGEFVIPDLPQGRFDLVVSCLSYETYHLSIQSDQIPEKLEIFLLPKAEELKEVILESYDKDGWDKWGKIFIDNFIGTAAFAEDCKLVNKEVLRLKLNKKTNTLKVSAAEQLVIENNALGYILRYDLTAFEFNLNTKEFLYQGYPFFTKMTTTRKGFEKRWEENRLAVYSGSLMHFLRSVFEDKVQEQNFQVREWFVIPETEKLRVKQMYAYQSRKKPWKHTTLFLEDGRSISVDEKDTATVIHPDSLAYYQSVMKQLDQKEVLINILLSRKNIAFAVNSLTTGLQFRHIQVIYTPKKPPEEYQPYLPKDLIYLPVSSNLYRTDEPVSVFSNGSFFDGRNLITANYWAWSEKICNKLPYDYQPPLQIK